MNIKMLREKRGYNAGDVIDLPDNMANVFIVQGIAEECTEAVTKPKSAKKAKPETPATDK